MPGRIDVGGYCLEIAATGVSAPPVVCVSGLTGAMGEWSEVREALDSRTSLVTYSRPALGTSDHLPAALAVKSHPPSWAAAQLQTLLDHAGVASPRILVGHSIGALIVEAYAARWPQEAAGMVLVDPAHPRGHLELFREPTPTDDEHGGIRFDMHAGHNERLHFPRPRFPTAVISGADDRWNRETNPDEYRPYTLDEIGRRWREFQREWVARTNAVHVIAHRAGHGVHEEAPDLVALAISAVLEAARGSTAMFLDPSAVDAAGGSLVAAPAEAR